jgi:hypothetical protein
LARKEENVMPAPGFVGSPYVGILGLDQQNPWSFLTTRITGNSVIKAVMQWDPAATGVYDLAMVASAFNYFSAQPGYFDGARIKISQGCLMPNNNHWVLYVVSP